MGLFSKPEVVFLKESSDATDYLHKLEELLPEANGEVKKQIQKEIAITKAGIAGEDNIAFELRNSGMDMFVLRDIFLRTEDGREAQIDFVVVTKVQTFLIECKNLFGNIKINSRGEFIRSFQLGDRKYKEGIYSPISQSERHALVYRDCRSERKGKVMRALWNHWYYKTFVDSLVVLANEKTIIDDKEAPKEVRNKVYRADQLNSVIAKMVKKMDKFENRSTIAEMRSQAEIILEMNQDSQKKYAEKFEKIVEQMKAESEKVPANEVKQICPRCGGELVMRTVRRGENAGTLFYGCSNFPKCRYTKSIDH